MDANVTSDIVDDCVGQIGNTVCYVSRIWNSIAHFLARYLLLNKVMSPFQKKILNFFNL